MGHLDVVARRKAGGGDEWKIYSWKVVGNSRDLLVAGGVPRILKSGPNKGKPTWRDVPTQQVVVTGAEIQAEHARYEAETGNCGDCMGKGEVIASWSASDGVKFRTCRRCNGSGKKGASHE